MKKIIAIITIILLLLIQTSAFANDVFSVTSNTGDVLGILNDVKVEKPALGNVVGVLGNVEVKSDVSGNVSVVLGDVRIDGKVYGNVVSVLGKITLTDRAEVMGNVTAIGEIEKAEGARILGQNFSMDMGFLPVSFSGISSFMVTMTIGYEIFVLLVGMLAIAIARERFKNISVGIEYRVGRRFGIGLLITVLCTIFFPLLAITVVGPIAYFLLLVLAEAVTAIYIGKLLMKMLNTNLNVYLEFFTGLMLIMLVKVGIWLVVPKGEVVILLLCGLAYILFSTFVQSLGVGVLIDSKFGSADAMLKYQKNDPGNKKTAFDNESSGFEGGTNGSNE